MFERKPEKIFYTNEAKEKDAQCVLDYYFRPRLTHDLSKNLPENRFGKNEDTLKYEKYIKAHSASADSILSYSQNNPDSVKFNFINKGDANVGWKFHLNCEPGSCKNISKFLADNDYYYKYLSGGGPEDGKIFTVYIGSHELAEKLAKEISDGVLAELSKPVDHSEIEFAPGVIGRFVGPRNEFHQYGTSGFSLGLYEYKQLLYVGHDKPEEEGSLAIKKITSGLEARSFARLKELYGDYFFRG